MNLSPHFTLAELTRSEAAARVGIDMRPPPAVLENLKRLCMTVLEPIRLAVGMPVFVTSGYRPEPLNTLIGGASNSDHLRGMAADIIVQGISIGELGWRVRQIQDEIPLRKAINEFGSWLHVSCEPAGVEPRREFLLASRDRGKTLYTLWDVA